MGALAALAALVPGAASAAQLSATPASLAGVFAGAGAGDTILLGPGDYGTFAGAQKGGMVTLQARVARTATMALDFNPASNITIDGLTLTEINIADSASKHITVRNSDIPGQTTLRTGDLANADILFDHNLHRDFDKCDSCGEGRIFLPGDTSQPSGITIQNSEFKGGLSDGILNGSNGTRILHNVFHDLLPGSPEGVHTDAIQLYGSSNTVIRGNYFYDVPDAIMSPDGANHELIEDNVIAADPDGYPFAITLFADNGSIIRHNTFPDGACTFNLRCGSVRVGAKDGDPHGHGTVIEDNILGEISLDESTATLAGESHNLIANDSVTGAGDIRAVASYVGGAHPSTYAGYALAPGSPGEGNASDGLDRGARIAAGAGGTPGPGPGGAGGSRLSVRVLSTLRSIGRTGRLRLAIGARAASTVVLKVRVRPGRAVRSAHGAHSRRLITLRAVVLKFDRAGRRTVALKLSRAARRTLGSSRAARISVRTYSDAARRHPSGSFSPRIKR